MEKEELKEKKGKRKKENTLHKEKDEFQCPATPMPEYRKVFPPQHRYGFFPRRLKSVKDAFTMRH